MPLDPRIQAFLEQAGLLTPPGSAPRAPEVLLAEMRANDEKAMNFNHFQRDDLICQDI